MRKRKCFTFLFCLILCYSLFQTTARAHISSQVNLSSQGSITYSSSSVNLAVIPDNWSTNIFSNVFIDSSIVHTSGKPSIRIEPRGTSGNTARECWGPVASVKPGDHVVGKCWIKIDPLPAGYTYEDFAGARIGFDLRNEAKGVWTYCLDTLEAPTYPDTTQGVKDNYVHWGTVGWVQRTIDFVVPSTFYTTDLYTGGSTIPSMQINSVSMWLQVWSTLYGGNEPGNAWFADAELYINPP